jgi:hypothetical protein
LAKTILSIFLTLGATHEGIAAYGISPDGKTVLFFGRDG